MAVVLNSTSDLFIFWTEMKDFTKTRSFESIVFQAKHKIVEQKIIDKYIVSIKLNESVKHVLLKWCKLVSLIVWSSKIELPQLDSTNFDRIYTFAFILFIMAVLMVRF